MKMMKFLALILVVVVASSSSAYPTSTQGACGDKIGLEVEGCCIFPIVNNQEGLTQDDFDVSKLLCEVVGAKLATLTTLEPRLDTVILDYMETHGGGDLCSFWVDGLYTGTNANPTKKITLSNDTVIDLTTSWRDLYPQVTPKVLRPNTTNYRSRVVYDVWKANTPDVNSLRGFRNVPAKAYNYILCQTKKDTFYEKNEPITKKTTTNLPTTTILPTITTEDIQQPMQDFNYGGTDDNYKHYGYGYYGYYGY